MQRVYEENEWGKVSKRIITGLLPFRASFSVMKERTKQLLPHLLHTLSGLLQGKLYILE